MAASNRSFLIAAAVMSLLMVGLIVWKLADEPPDAPPAPPPARTAEKPAPAEPPPPPPPEDEMLDAGIDRAEQAAIPRRTAGATGPCSGGCRGRDTAELRSALASRARQSRGCYERALRQNPTLMGQLLVAVKIGPKGEVCAASIASDSLAEPAVGSCVLQKFRSASFPAPAGGCAEIQVPINFMPKP